jgi:hypothetical protein
MIDSVEENSIPKQYPEVDFDCHDRSETIYTWLTFWDSTKSWLAGRGYTLFEYGYHWRNRYINEETYWAPKLIGMSLSDVRHPFAKCGGDEMGIPVPPLSGCVVVSLFVLHAPSTLIRFKKRIAFAQDSLQRHVALRLTKKTSDEYKIWQLLIKEASLQSLEGFDGVLPPLDLFDFGDHCIMVMPRYSNFWFRESILYSSTTS